MKTHRNRNTFIGLLLALILIFSSCTKEPDHIISDTVTMNTHSNVVTATETNVETVTDLRSDPINILVCDRSARLGGYLILKTKNIENHFTYTDFYGRECEFMKYEDAYYSLIPIACYDEPGDYTLSFEYEDWTYSYDVTIKDITFETQELTVDDTTAEQTLKNQEAKDVYREIVNIYTSMEPSQYREELNYIFPLKDNYIVTTKYGTFRTFNTGDTEYHEAVDLAAKKRTPVYATNSGKVLFSKYTEYTGNTVIIDHGMGILSWYFHLNSFNVNEGEIVIRNQLIARVGTTGLSTGSHLHFGITVNGIFIDPDTFINGNFEFFTFMETE